LVGKIRFFGEFWEKRSDLDRPPTKFEGKSAFGPIQGTRLYFGNWRFSQDHTRQPFYDIRDFCVKQREDGSQSDISASPGGVFALDAEELTSATVNIDYCFSRQYHALISFLQVQKDNKEFSSMYNLNMVEC
jgi:hypothetical protein